MSEEGTVAARAFPDSTFKWPRPFGNLSNASAYPPFTPVDTKKRTSQVFKFSFYTTAGAYAWLYVWRRSTFKLGLPATVIAFATVATGAKAMITNIREKNDGWNTLWGVAAGNLTVLTVGFKSMPLKHKILTGVSGAVAAAFVDHFRWSQSTSSAYTDVTYEKANTDADLPQQKFWDVWQRRPLSQTVDQLGEGRGFLKP
ncbi:hypothetical protein CAAN1_29S00166 [[Candida] anglica]|uniref:NADH-ubiquinone oxidoreductase subunit B14.7 n=1 Tax=[Candida] anglica TaxID=148631 RepID=A0ABP0EG98_9ASCO